MQGMENFEGDNAHGLADQAYTDTLTIGSGNDQIDLYYFGAGHTNGDTFVVTQHFGFFKQETCFRGVMLRFSIEIMVGVASRCQIRSNV